jgi:hypothetical protein
MVVVYLAGAYLDSLGQLHPTCNHAPVYSLRARIMLAGWPAAWPRRGGRLHGAWVQHTCPWVKLHYWVINSHYRNTLTAHETENFKLNLFDYASKLFCDYISKKWIERNISIYCIFCMYWIICNKENLLLKTYLKLFYPLSQFLINEK